MESDKWHSYGHHRTQTASSDYQMEKCSSREHVSTALKSSGVVLYPTALPRSTLHLMCARTENPFHEPLCTVLKLIWRTHAVWRSVTDSAESWRPLRTMTSTSTGLASSFYIIHHFMTLEYLGATGLVAQVTSHRCTTLEVTDNLNGCPNTFGNTVLSIETVGYMVTRSDASFTPTLRFLLSLWCCLTLYFFRWYQNDVPLLELCFSYFFFVLFLIVLLRKFCDFNSAFPSLGLDLSKMEAAGRTYNLYNTCFFKVCISSVFYGQNCHNSNSPVTRFVRTDTSFSVTSLEVKTVSKQWVL